MVISSILARLSGWKEYYIIYNHRLFYVFGLVFSRSMTNYALINVLAWYFTYYEEDNLAMSSILSNFRDSLSSLLVIFMAASAADSYVGRFHTLVFSNIAYIFGLMLLWMFNPYDVKWLVFIILVLLALGTSGDQLLQQVLEDLVNDIIDKSQDQTKERSIARAKIWTRILKVIAAIVTILLVAPHDAVVHSTWKSTFLICMGFMATCSIIFCIGHNSYHQGQLNEEGPLSVFFRHMRIKKLLKSKSRRINDSSRLDRSLHNVGTDNREGEGITPERSPLSVDTNRQEANGCSSYKNDDIVIEKSLLRMFPMWGIFFVMSLISATGSTFFFQQYSNLNGTDKIAVVQIYDLLKNVSSFAIPFLYHWICGICGLHKNEKVKIGVGMLFGIVSCLFAWQLEVQRLKKVNNLQDDEEQYISISFLWLMPQFAVLGCMEGLTLEGLLGFYRSQMKEEPLQSYGEEYTEVVMGFGTAFNMILVFFVNNILGWFGDTINESRLDHYYLLLVFVGLADFIIFYLIARYYYKDAEQHQDLVNDDLNQGLELSACDNHEQDNQLPANAQERDNQLMGNDDKERDNQLLASDGQKQDNQLLPNNDQEQDNQLLPNGDQKQDNQLLVNDLHKQQNQLLANDDQKQDNQLLTTDDKELDNQLLASDDRKQDNQLLHNNDQEQDNQLLANDEHEQENQLMPNSDQKQDNQLLVNDLRKQQNQLLANDDQKQDNQLLTTAELQRNDQTELR